MLTQEMDADLIHASLQRGDEIAGTGETISMVWKPLKRLTGIVSLEGTSLKRGVNERATQDITSSQLPRGDERALAPHRKFRQQSILQRHHANARLVLWARRSAQLSGSAHSPRAARHRR